MTLIATYSRRRVRQVYEPRTKQEGDVIRQRSSAFTSQDTSSYSSDILLRKLKKALPPQDGEGFSAHFAKLEALATDRTLLVRDSDPPSAITLARARAFLQQLETEALQPTRVVASVEGGVAICFVTVEKYSDIECLNSEEILGVISNRRDHPVVWQIDPTPSGLARAVARIRDFLRGAPSAYEAERQAR